jgi:hypothetical protein
MRARRVALLKSEVGAQPITHETRHLVFRDDGRHAVGEQGDGVFGADLAPIQIDGPSTRRHSAILPLLGALPRLSHRVRAAGLYL